MKASSLLLAGGFALLFAAGLSASRAPVRGPERFPEGRPQFYAKEILDQVNVMDADKALGEPDGRFAEIPPGGEMTVLMDERIRYSDSSDDGSVVTKGEGRYGLAGLFRMSEEGAPAWLPLAPGGTPGGFKLGGTMFPVAQSTGTIRIANDDTRSVFVDAVIGYRQD